MFRDLLANWTKTTLRKRTATPRWDLGFYPQPLSCRNILLVEQRDEVFDRVATDLTAAGLQITRARHAAAAIKKCVHFSPDLLVANFDLPDSSGWLLTAKARLMFPTPNVWLYAPWPSPQETAMAQFVGADGLFAYRGDVRRLSAVIISRLAVLPALRLGA